jgi:hypothetical protein
MPTSNNNAKKTSSVARSQSGKTQGNTTHSGQNLKPGQTTTHSAKETTYETITTQTEAKTYSEELIKSLQEQGYTRINNSDGSFKLVKGRYGYYPTYYDDQMGRETFYYRDTYEFNNQEQIKSYVKTYDYVISENSNGYVRESTYPATTKTYDNKERINYTLNNDEYTRDNGNTGVYKSYESTYKYDEPTSTYTVQERSYWSPGQTGTTPITGNVVTKNNGDGTVTVTDNNNTWTVPIGTRVNTTEGVVNTGAIKYAGNVYQETGNYYANLLMNKDTIVIGDKIYQVSTKNMPIIRAAIKEQEKKNYEKQIINKATYEKRKREYEKEYEEYTKQRRKYYEQAIKENEKGYTAEELFEAEKNRYSTKGALNIENYEEKQNEPSIRTGTNISNNNNNYNSYNAANKEIPKSWEANLQNKYADVPIGQGLQYSGGTYAYAKSIPTLKTISTIASMPGLGAKTIWDYTGGLALQWKSKYLSDLLSYAQRHKWNKLAIKAIYEEYKSTDRLMGFTDVASSIAPYMTTGPAGGIIGAIALGSGVASSPTETYESYKKRVKEAIGGNTKQQGELAAEALALAYAGKEAYKAGDIPFIKPKKGTDTGGGGPIKGTRTSKGASDSVENQLGYRSTTSFKEMYEYSKGRYKNRLSLSEDFARNKMIRSMQEINAAMKIMQGKAFGKETSGNAEPLKIKEGIKSLKNKGTEAYVFGSQSLRKSAPRVMEKVDATKGGIIKESDTDVMIRKRGETDYKPEWKRTTNPEETALQNARTMYEASQRKYTPNKEATKWADDIARKGLKIPEEATTEQISMLLEIAKESPKWKSVSEELARMIKEKSTNRKNMPKSSNAELVGSFADIMRARAIKEYKTKQLTKETNPTKKLKLEQEIKVWDEIASKIASEKDIDIHLFNKKQLKKVYKKLSESTELDWQMMKMQYQAKGKIGTTEPTLGSYTELPRIIGKKGRPVLEGASANKKWTPNYVEGPTTKITWLDEMLKPKRYDATMAITEQQPGIQTGEMMKAPPDFILIRGMDGKIAKIDLATARRISQRIKERLTDNVRTNVKNIGNMRIQKQEKAILDQIDRAIHAKDINQRLKGAKKTLWAERAKLLDSTTKKAEATDIANQIIKPTLEREAVGVTPDSSTYMGRYGAEAKRLSMEKDPITGEEALMEGNKLLDVKSEKSMLRHHTRKTTETATGERTSELPSEAIEKAQAHILRGKESDLKFAEEYIKEAERWYKENYQMTKHGKIEDNKAWNLIQKAKEDLNAMKNPKANDITENKLMFERLKAKMQPYETRQKSLGLTRKAKVELLEGESKPIEIPRKETYTSKELSKEIKNNIDKLSNNKGSKETAKFKEIAEKESMKKSEWTYEEAKKKSDGIQREFQRTRQKVKTDDYMKGERYGYGKTPLYGKYGKKYEKYDFYNKYEGYSPYKKYEGYEAPKEPYKPYNPPEEPYIPLKVIPKQYEPYKPYNPPEEPYNPYTPPTETYEPPPTTYKKVNQKITTTPIIRTDYEGDNVGWRIVYKRKGQGNQYDNQRFELQEDAEAEAIKNVRKGLYDDYELKAEMVKRRERLIRKPYTRTNSRLPYENKNTPNQRRGHGRFNIFPYVFPRKNYNN